MYVVLGASGNTGSVVANTLLDKGEKVRVVGRNAERLQDFKGRGAEVFVGDAADASSLAKAFAGAKAVYAMVPPDTASPDVLEHYKRCSDAIVAALKQAGVKRVVALSSVAADKSEKTGPILGVHYLEQQLAAIPGLNATILRPAYFMENTLAQAGAIQKMNVAAGPLKGDIKFPMIATRDIGAAAAKALLDGQAKGSQILELHGQRDLSMDEATQIIGKAIGKPDLRYMQLTDAQAKPAMVQMGLSPSMADGFLELSASMNSGFIRFQQPRSAENTTPTSYEEFVKTEFVPAYKGAKAA